MRNQRSLSSVRELLADDLDHARDDGRHVLLVQGAALGCVKTQFIQQRPQAGGLAEGRCDESV